MTNDVSDTITVHLTIPSRWEGDNVVGGQNFTDDEGRTAARLFLKDAAGERHVTVHEGDRVEFAGSGWQVSTVFDPTDGPRRRVATLTKVL